MIEVVKYLEPLWYFNLKAQNDAVIYFPDYNKLSDEKKRVIHFDTGYEKMSLLDAAFQALKKGVFVDEISAVLDNDLLENIPVVDLYRFSRKYYASKWTIYFCLMRLINLNNPVKELFAFFRTLNVTRNHLYSEIPDSKQAIVTLIDAKVSIILPTLNRYDQLKDVLYDISQQTVKAFEIIIIDQSDAGNGSFYKEFEGLLPLRVVYQQKKGQWSARNEAVHLSTGDYILFLDDDSRIAEDWIEKHLNTLCFFNADISAGISITEGEQVGRDKMLFRYADEFDSGNALVRRELFSNLGLFDETFNGYRMGDADFGMRAYLSGFKSVSNPLAKRIHVHTLQGGLREWGSVKSFVPVSFFGRRPDVGVLYYYKKYFDQNFLLSFLIARIFSSYTPTFKNEFWNRIIGSLSFLIMSPWWMLQLIFSLKQTSRMRNPTAFKTV